MTLRFRLREQAEADIESIWEYIASDDVKAANAVITRITDTLDWLAETAYGWPREARTWISPPKFCG